jgi:hypothetical protein
MPKNSKYYLQVETTGTKYSATQSNVLDVSRMLQHKPFWRQPFGEVLTKKKVLVINDPTIGKWDMDECIVAAERFKALQQEGFEIYFRKGEEFYALDTPLLKFPKQIVDPEPLASKKISELAAKKLKLSHDQLFVLNHQELTELMDGTNEDWSELASLERVDLHGSNIGIASLTELLKKSGNKIKSLNLSQCVNLKKGTIPEDIALDGLEELIIGGEEQSSTFFPIPALGGDNQPRVNNLNTLSIKNLLKSAPNLKVLKLVHCTNLSDEFLHDLNLNSLETLDLSVTSIDSLTLAKILAKTPKLKALKLNWCKKLGDNQLPDDLNLSSLETLDLSDTIINGQTLGKLLAKAPKLQVLKLKLNDNLPDGLNLASLETLHLSGSKINSESLCTLLASTPKLKELKLNSFENLSGGLTVRLNLTSLEKLELDSSNISNKSLGRLLVKAPKLKELKLWYCNNLSDNEFPDELDLASLESLILLQSNISSLSLGKILSKAPNIKILYLLNCNDLSDDLTDDFSLDSLETLDLSNSNINNMSLDKLLDKAPKLKKLILTYRDNVPDSLNAASLECVHLWHSKINSKSLGEFLAKVSKLKELSLRFCTNLSDNHLPDDLNLASLEILDLTKSNISGLSLSKILAKTPKLKRLDLSDYKNFRDVLTDGLNFASLEMLDLIGSNISPLSLGKILALAPKLKELNLSLNDNLIDGLPLGSVETISLMDSEINSLSFGNLLVNAPKLKSITLMKCTITENNLPDRLNLASLETLTIWDSKISSLTFGMVLANATRLNEIDLSGCTITGDDLPDGLKLDSLQTLKLDNCPISSDLIKKIQSKAPHVKIIYPEAVQSSAKEKNTLDANTELDPNKKFNLNRIFYAGGTRRHPEPNDYRLETFDDFEVNQNSCPDDKAFTLRNKSVDLKIEERQIPQSATDLKEKLSTLPDANQYYYGIQKLNLGSEWQALASLSAEEVMTDYHLSPAAEVEFGYSKRDNLYYIRRKPGSSQTDIPITIDFILKTPVVSPDTLPADIQEKIKECLNFGVDSLRVKPDATGADYLSALKTQKVGACRHRSLVFKAWIEERDPPLPTRIVNNDCHSFVEVYYNKRWIASNLGGYPAELVINEQSQAKPVIQKLSTEGTIVTPAKTKLQSKSTAEPLVHKSKEQPAHKKSYFHTSSIEEAKPDSTRIYMEHLLSSPGHKKLINVQSDQSLNGFRHHLQNYCKSTKRPCFYIHSPEDLMCSAPYIKRDGTTGTITKGPGGPLHDFLKQHRKGGSKPVLIVNYDQFSASDIVRFNALLDKERFADGSPLPEDAEVIGLMNPSKPGAYDGADFRSRFDAMLTNSLSNEQLAIPQVAEKTRPLTDNAQSINLYGGNDWEDRLLGHWVLKGKNLHFVEGELLVAIKNNKNHIELKNAPWGNEAFQAFWQEALLFGSFQSHGVRYDLPKDFKLSQAEGYSFEKTSKYITVNEKDDISADAITLNRGLFARFLGQYLCDTNSETIKYEEGLLAKNPKKTINLYLSDSLDLNSWALFLDTCQQHEVVINVTLAPGVTLPKELGLNAKIRTAAPAVSWSSDNTKATAYVQSTDIDATLSQLPEQALILDVSEVSSAELLIKLDGTFNEDTLTFRFNEQEGALLKALEEDKTVVLKGHISEELRHVLSEFLLQRQREGAPKGRLIIMSDQAQLFPMIPSLIHAVTPEEKIKLIAHKFPEEMYSQHSLVALQAMARHLALHPDDSGDKAWQGLSTLPPSPIPKAIDLEHAEDIATAFNKQRLTSVEDLLKHSPFVFLAGMTGVGKTTFIHEVWGKKHGKVYFDEASKLAWAKDRSAGIKTLFIDEANISARQWSEFEGLFRKPPRILIGNEVIELTSEHKVIFAGNPLSYGGERQMPSLFARHGNSIIFDPLPPEYLYQTLLKPIFDEANLNSKEVALPILEVAQYLSGLDREKMLITPRELGMMALLTVSYCKKHPEAIATEVARYYAYTLSERFVPDQNKETFEAQFKKVDKLERLPLKMPEDLLITANNQPAFDALCDLMDLRALRQSKGIQAQGGLGGLIIEGEPGLGKTEVVVKTLVAHGLKKGDLNKEHPDGHVFYVLPVSMSSEEKVKILRKAFHEGAPVVIDEINSAPMMERLLNDLLMGKDPDGELAKKPGFMVIGTQNPDTMAGRVRASTALEHRMQKIIITEYPKEEMLKILAHKGLPENICQNMVAEYLILKQKALQDSTPPLCFRDLINRAEQEITALSKIIREEFNNRLMLLENKKEQFLSKVNEGKKEYRKAYEAADAIHFTLKSEGERYFANPTQEKYSKFNKKCTKCILDNRVELEKHRGLAKIILNVLAFIVTVGIGYGIALGIGKLFKGKNFSFYSTDSEKKINAITETVEKAVPKTVLPGVTHKYKDHVKAIKPDESESNQVLIKP